MKADYLHNAIINYSNYYADDAFYEEQSHSTCDLSLQQDTVYFSKCA